MVGGGRLVVSFSSVRVSSADAGTGQERDPSEQTLSSTGGIHAAHVHAHATRAMHMQQVPRSNMCRAHAPTYRGTRWWR